VIAPLSREPPSDGLTLGNCPTWNYIPSWQWVCDNVRKNRSMKEWCCFTNIACLIAHCHLMAWRSEKSSPQIHKFSCKERGTLNLPAWPFHARNIYDTPALTHQHFWSPSFSGWNCASREASTDTKNKFPDAALLAVVSVHNNHTCSIKLPSLWLSCCTKWDLRGFPGFGPILSAG